MFGGKGNSPKSSKKREIEAHHSSLNTINKGTSVIGEINSEGIIRIDGTVKGTVRSKSKIAVGKTGLIEGDLLCQNADIEGKVIGKVNVSDLLFIRGNANVQGDIITNKLVVESGAKFNGSCVMGAGAIQHGEQQTPTLKKEAV